MFFNFEFYIYIVLTICAIHTSELALLLVLSRVTMATTHHQLGKTVLSHDGIIPARFLLVGEQPHTDEACLAVKSHYRRTKK